MASGSFDRSFERVWESLPLPEQVTLPWDTDHWNSVFGSGLQSMTNPVVSFRRPIGLFPGMTREMKPWLDEPNW